MIDLSKLPAPSLMQTDYPTLLQSMRDSIVLAYPEIESTIDLESEPIRKLIELFAYQQFMTISYVNDVAKQTMLAFANGSNLDQIGGTFAVERLTNESDERFRARIQESFEGYTTAGSYGAYRFHSMGASPEIKDVKVTSSQPGTVDIYVLGQNGLPSQAILDAVYSACNAEDVRPLCDTVVVHPCQIVGYSINAQINIPAGPDSSVIYQAALASINGYTQSALAIGNDINISAIHAALHVEGVKSVSLAQPLSDIIITDYQAPLCASINLSVSVSYG
jgi:phage-related baseplate assembly protein